MELVRRVAENQPGTKELFRWGGGYLVVSTVNLHESIKQADPTSQAIAGLANALSNMPGSGEETMAFRADEKGDIQDWTEVACARGEGSRDVVLAELEEKETTNA